MAPGDPADKAQQGSGFQPGQWDCRASSLPLSLVLVTLARRAKQSLWPGSPQKMADYQATRGVGVLQASLCTDANHALAKEQGRNWLPQLRERWGC